MNPFFYVYGLSSLSTFGVFALRRMLIFMLTEVEFFDPNAFLYKITRKTFLKHLIYVELVTWSRYS